MKNYQALEQILSAFKLFVMDGLDRGAITFGQRIDPARRTLQQQRGLRGIWSVPVGGGPEVPVLQSAWHNAWAVAEGGIYYLCGDQKLRMLKGGR